MWKTKMTSGGPRQREDHGYGSERGDALVDVADPVS